MTDLQRLAEKISKDLKRCMIARGDEKDLIAWIMESLNEVRNEAYTRAAEVARKLFAGDYPHETCGKMIAEQIERLREDKP